MNILKIIIGISLIEWHFLIFMLCIFLIAALGQTESGNFAILAIVVFTYALNLYFKDCIWTVFESKFLPFTSADIFGNVIPNYEGSKKHRAILGSTIIVTMLIFVLFRALKFLLIRLTKNRYEILKVENEKKKRKNRRRGVY